MTQILVVDPNEAFSTLLAEELKRQGYDVQAFGEGASVLKAVQASAPDLVLLDMGLEDPDSITLVGQLREQHTQLRLMLIPMFGEALSPKASQLPVQGVLPKPFFLPELPERIEAALNAPLSGIAVSVAEPAPEPDPEPGLPPEPALEPPVPDPVPLPKPEPAVAETVPSVVGEIEEWGLSHNAVQANLGRIQAVMGELEQELAADVVLLTVGRRMITSVGRLNPAEADLVARTVVQGWMTSERVARILDCEQKYFEQSITGEGYMLYAISVDVNAILAVAIRGTAPLGLLRHRARGTAERIREISA